MKSIFITGNDTEIGKTHVSILVVNALLSMGREVVYLKPVQCGVDPDGKSDLMRVKQSAQGNLSVKNFFHFEQAIAPLAAAKYQSSWVEKHLFLDAWNSLSADLDEQVVVIEGAGGIAVPLDQSGWDWADFAKEIKVDATLLVVGNRLGSINQTRLAEAHLQRKGIVPHVLLNANETCSPQITESNIDGLLALIEGGISTLEHQADRLPDSFLKWLEEQI